MITVIGMWEPSFSEYEQVIEYRMWKQTIAAFDVHRWLMVGDGPRNVTSFESFDTMPEALDTVDGQRIFLVPEHGQDYTRFRHIKSCAYIFGNAEDNLLKYVTSDNNDWIANIPTPKSVDLFAAAILPLVLAWR